MNKLAIVTGASSGIGEATARRLAKLGYNLVITARRRERLEKLAEELISTYGIKIQILSFDVRDREATEQALSTIDKSLGDICVLMNNAGLAA
ncbi:MAG: SDR family NAD(P)-dependent oxidoreductase, partial [Rikenellaceae bacterium]|nr:SDR family NAD(P)-dependent oxidoreductase [Rikenellaceae bacterium]